MNIKINDMKKGDYWLNQTLNSINSYNILNSNFSLEFDSKIVQKINNGC